MPTILLHGGLITANTASNKAFYKTMADAVPPGGTWLGVYFASTSDREGPKYKSDSRKVKAAVTHKFTTVLATQENFPQQLKKADVIFFAGGATAGLMNQVKAWPELKSWLKKAKFIAGSSAGANLLCQTYTTKNAPHHGQGLGLVPYNIVVHLNAPAYAHITPPPAPYIALPETQFCLLQI